MTTAYNTTESTAPALHALPTLSPQLVTVATSTEARECMQQADHVLFLVASLGLEAMVEAIAPVEWRAGQQLVEAGYTTPHTRLYGYLLGLTAVDRAGVGGALVTALVQRVRALLVEAPPAA